MPRLAALLLVLVSACTARQRTRCEDTCRHEATCAREMDREFDEAECVEACSALDRDPALRPAVDRHVNCVLEARDCEALLACD